MLDLDALHTRMTEVMAGALPELRTLDAFPTLGDEVYLPALVFGLVELKHAKGRDNGTGKAPLEARFQACILVEPNQPRAPLQAANFATRLTALLRGQYWETDDVDAAEEVSAQPDGSAPELAQFLVWVVEWTHVLYVGAEEWDWENQPPGSLQMDIEGEQTHPEELE